MIFENTGKKRWNELDDNTKGILLLAWHNGLQIQYWSQEDNEWNNEECIEDCAYNPFIGYNQYAFRIKPESVKYVRWCNDYEYRPIAKWHNSREAADEEASDDRIAVIRREIVDGVVSYFREAV